MPILTGSAAFAGAAENKAAATTAVAAIIADGCRTSSSLASPAARFSWIVAAGTVVAGRRLGQTSDHTRNRAPGTVNAPIGEARRACPAMVQHYAGTVW